MLIANHILFNFKSAMPKDLNEKWLHFGHIQHSYVLKNMVLNYSPSASNRVFPKINLYSF